MKNILKNSADDIFLKKVSELKLKDDKNKMGLSNNSNLYSTQFDGIVSKDSSENSFTTE